MRDFLSWRMPETNQVHLNFGDAQQFFRKGKLLRGYLKQIETNYEWTHKFADLKLMLFFFLNGTQISQGQ